MDDDTKDQVFKICGDAKILRNEGRVDEAREKIKGAEKLLAGYDIKDCPREYSLFSYEDGFIYNAEGKYPQSIEKFTKSKEAGAEANNITAEFVGEFRAGLTGYYSAEIDPPQSLQELEALKARWLKERENPDVSKKWWQGSYDNLRVRLADVAFDVSDTKFVQYAQDMLDSPSMYDKKDDVLHDFLVARLTARLEMIHGRFDKAAEIFRTFLGYDSDKIEWDDSVKNAGKINELIHVAVEEIARDYRDFGVAVSKSSLPDAEVIAREIWNYAIAETDEARGNRRYHIDMRALLGAS